MSLSVLNSVPKLIGKGVSRVDHDDLVHVLVRERVLAGWVVDHERRLAHGRCEVAVVDRVDPSPRPPRPMRPKVRGSVVSMMLYT